MEAHELFVDGADVEESEAVRSAALHRPHCGQRQALAAVVVHANRLDALGPVISIVENAGETKILQAALQLVAPLRFWPARIHFTVRFGGDFPLLIS